MSKEMASRTCAEVIEHIGGRADIPLRRRQDLTSAVRSLCRLLNRNPREVPADVDKLRYELAQLRAQLGGSNANMQRFWYRYWGRDSLMERIRFPEPTLLIASYQHRNPQYSATI